MIRTATRADLDLMVAWAAAEGWNPGLDDADAFWAADPEGFFVTEVAGAPVACISVVNHSETFAFLGFYICAPSHRGRGLGYALWQHALAHAGTRTVGLDGVADQEANYAKSGFVRVGATTRYEGRPPLPSALACRAMGPADLPQAMALDRAATGIDRPAFLGAWFTESETRKSYVLDAGDGLAGVVTARRCRAGVKLGPVLAQGQDAADLICHAAQAMAAERVIVDLPERQTDLATRLAAWGFEPSFATARMYRGPAPQATALEHAIATMELG